MCNIDSREEKSKKVWAAEILLHLKLFSQYLKNIP